jgi:3-isopropylmalate dehydrogenase
LNYSGDLWERTFLDVSRDYPDVRTACDQYVDAAGMRMVKQPNYYDVVVTDNMFGDILSDFGDALAGSIGSSASANLNPERTGPSMFEPVHGSAPDIAGTGTANPMAAIRSVAMMLDFLGRTELAEAIETACVAVEAGGGHNGDLVKTTDSVIKNL